MSDESGVAAYADEARDWAALTAASAAEAMSDESTLRGPQGSPEYATAEYVDDVTTIVRGLEKRSRDHIGHIGALRLRIETLERLNIAASKQRVMLGVATIVQSVAIIVLAVTR